MNIQKYDSLDTAICAVAGNGANITKAERVSGGDINRAYALTLSGGEKIFMKANAPENVRFFSVEAHGLFALAEAARQSGRASANVAKPLAYGVEASAGASTSVSAEASAPASASGAASASTSASGLLPLPRGAFSFLLLEYIESGRGTRDAQYWANFGHELAALHLSDASAFVRKVERASSGCDVSACDDTPASGRFGFFEDNYIGATPQINSPRSTWIDFFRECRLLPQIKMAERYFDAAFLRKCDAFLSRLEKYISEPKQPSILHGDLWGGNVMCGADGKAWLIDPAVYAGHFEADLAMTQLFGSFPRVFYDAYGEINPIEKGYETRREIYNLYQLLNHLNLFGAGYLGEVRSIIEMYA